MLKNMFLAVIVAIVFSAAAVSALQLKSVPHATNACRGICSASAPCPSQPSGCTCLSAPGERGFCTVVGPAATARR